MTQNKFTKKDIEKLELKHIIELHSTGKLLSFNSYKNIKNQLTNRIAPIQFKDFIKLT